MIMVADFTGELRLELQLPRSAAKRTMFLITEFIGNIKPKGGGHNAFKLIGDVRPQIPRMGRRDFMKRGPFLFVASLLAAGCVAGPKDCVVKCADQAVAPGTTTIAEFGIPANELPQLEVKALDGDKLSAIRLTKYYMLAVNDYQKTRFWMQIAAENGDPSAVLNLIALLRSDLPYRDPELRRHDDERLCFWVRKAIADGLPKARLYSGDRRRCKIAS
jgi:hypothetical protein